MILKEKLFQSFSEESLNHMTNQYENLKFSINIFFLFSSLLQIIHKKKIITPKEIIAQISYFYF